MQVHYHLDYSRHDELDEQIISPNKIETPTLDDHRDPWIFYRWIDDMNQFFE